MKKKVQYVRLGDSLASIYKVEESGRAYLKSVHVVDFLLDIYNASTAMAFRVLLADVAALRAKLVSDEDGEVHQLSESDCVRLCILLKSMVGVSELFQEALPNRERHMKVARIASTVGLSLFAILSGLSIASLTPLAIIPSMPIALAGVLLAVGTVGTVLSGFALRRLTKIANLSGRESPIKVLHEAAEACHSLVGNAYEASMDSSLLEETPASGSPVAAAAMKPSAACAAPRASAAAAKSAVGSPAPAAGQG